MRHLNNTKNETFNGFTFDKKMGKVLGVAMEKKHDQTTIF